MNPSNDLVITTSFDKTSRIWDTSNRTCVCIVQDSLCVSFDPSGKFFVSVTAEYDKIQSLVINFLNFYMIENFGGNFSNGISCEGPSKVVKITEMNRIIQMKFSHDGLFIIFKDVDNIKFVHDLFSRSRAIRSMLSRCDEKIPVKKDFRNFRENFCRFDMSRSNNMSNEVEIFANFLIDSDGEGKIEIWDYEKTCLLNLLQYPLN